MLVIAESQFPDNSCGSGPTRLHVHLHYHLHSQPPPIRINFVSTYGHEVRFIESGEFAVFSNDLKKTTRFERPQTPALYHHSHFPEFVDIDFGLPADSYHVAAKY